MSFTNLYYKRTTGTAKACYVCYKPTTTVLATINTVDFLYTCLGHLSDSGFASQIKDEPKATPAVTAEEIARVKAEYEEKQKKKAEKEKEKAKEESKDKESDKEKEKDDKADTKVAQPPIPSVPATPSGQSTPSHERYTLHRDFFSMRQAEHRKRRQTAQAKDLAPRLPAAPNNGVV
ncbi:VPS4-associated protein 1 [Crepidotus variabilis]|uniref:VPS4-associated protein 1 n=1 Tax=Crepidotus variabilis TaxID=179855 RepID=A0A9P6JVX9_9AGAR|nr:VPS4-associated protein 1 [Crepidotus variabilis]